MKIQAPITSLLCIAWTIIIYASSIDFEYYEWMSISYLVDGLGRVGITVLLTVLVYTGKPFMKETDKPEMQRTSLAYALFPIGVLFLVNSLSIINSSAFYYMLQLGDLYHYMGMAFYPTVTFISALLLTAAAFNYCRIRSRALNLIIAVLAFVFAAGDLIVELVPLLISML